jgi:hypothetical protein
VLYALGGADGGLTCNIDDGFLCYEDNTFIVMRTPSAPRASSRKATPKIQIDTAYAEARPAGPLDITITVKRGRLRVRSDPG